MSAPDIHQFIREQIEAQTGNPRTKVKLMVIADQEPDDSDAHNLLLGAVPLLKEQYPTVDFEIDFVLGKGEANVKIAAFNKVLEEIPSETNSIDGTTIKVMQGYMSGFEFKKEGVAYLTQEEIDIAKKASLTNEQVDEQILEQLQKDDLPTYIICIKPPEELIQLREKNPEIFRKCYFAGSGGNNFREIQQSGDVDLLLRAFKEVLTFESTHNTTEYTKSFTEKDNPDLFTTLEAVSINNQPGAYIQHKKDWSDHILASDLKYFCDIINADVELSLVERFKAIDRVTQAYNAGWSCESEALIRSHLNLAPYVEKRYEALESKPNTQTRPGKTEKEIAEEIRNIKEALMNEEIGNINRRIYLKWKILTQKGLSSLSVDVQLMMAVLGYTEYMRIERVAFNFHQIKKSGNDVLHPISEHPEGCYIHTVLPKVELLSLEELLSQAQALPNDVKRLGEKETKQDQSQKSSALGADSPLVTKVSPLKTIEERVEEKLQENPVFVAQKYAQLHAATKLTNALKAIYSIEKTYSLRSRSNNV